MVVFLSYVLAVILTIALAVVLYPIAALFWIVGLFGKISDGMFKFTRKTISKLWRDLGKMNKNEVDDSSKWTCNCGCSNTGKFCSNCGAPMPQVAEIENKN